MLSVAEVAGSGSAVVAWALSSTDKAFSVPVAPLELGVEESPAGVVVSGPGLSCFVVSLCNIDAMGPPGFAVDTAASGDVEISVESSGSGVTTGESDGDGSASDGLSWVPPSLDAAGMVLCGLPALDSRPLVFVGVAFEGAEHGAALVSAGPWTPDPTEGEATFCVVVRA